MRLQIYERKEFTSGLLFIAIGTGAGVYAKRYTLGTATDMGPGYFPIMVSAVLVVVGAVAIIRAMRSQEREAIGALHVGPAVLITLGVICFGLLVDFLASFPPP